MPLVLVCLIESYQKNPFAVEFCIWYVQDSIQKLDRLETPFNRTVPIESPTLLMNAIGNLTINDIFQKDKGKGSVSFPLPFYLSPVSFNEEMLKLTLP